MKKFTALMTLLLAGTLMTTAQDKKDPPKSPAGTASNEYASITYNRPYKKDRVIFGDLVPYDKVWRTGANMSTDITFKKDVLIEGEELKAGTYAIFTIPRADAWTVIFNSVPKQRGASEYEKNKDKNALTVEVPVQEVAEPTEQFTISLPDDGILFQWDQVQVHVPVEVQ